VAGTVSADAVGVVSALGASVLSALGASVVSAAGAVGAADDSLLESSSPQLVARRARTDRPPTSQVRFLRVVRCTVNLCFLSVFVR
jgi:hypothetical protein